MENKIIAHILGGGATRISDLVLRELISSNPAFPKWEFHYGDTSRANYDKIEPLGDITLIKSKLVGNEGVLDGSGADRAANLEDISLGVEDYVNKHKLFKNKIGEYHLVFFTAGGGTSSVMGPLLIKDLLSKDINVVGICVGDSSTAVSNRNTLNTLASLDSIAKKLDKSLSLIYFNNYSESPDNIKKGEEIVNNKLRNSLAILSVFLSGANADIDNKDMEVFIEQRRYTAFKVPSGLMRLVLSNKELDLDKGVKATMVRSLTMGDERHDLDYDLIHSKNGKVTDPDVLKLVKDHVPLFAISLSNYFVKENHMLQDKLKYFQNVFSSITNEEISASDDANQDFGILV